MQRERRAGRGERADQQRAFAADDHHAELRRQRRAQRGQDQRRGARQRVLPGEPGAERALIHVEIEVERVLPEQRDEDAEQHERANQRERGDEDVFGRAAELREQKWAGEEARRPGILQEARRPARQHRLHEVAPMHAFDQIIHLFQLGIGLACEVPAAITVLPLLSAIGP